MELWCLSDFYCRKNRSNSHKHRPDRGHLIKLLKPYSYSTFYKQIPPPLIVWYSFQVTMFWMAWNITSLVKWLLYCGQYVFIRTRRYYLNYFAYFSMGHICKYITSGQFVLHQLYIGCLTQSLYQMMVVSFNNNTTGVTSGAGTTILPERLSSYPGISEVRVAQSLVCCVM